MKNFLTLTAILEAGTGMALLIAPALVVRILLGVPLDTAGGLAVGRVAGAALLALAIACWGARGDTRSRAAAGVIAAMLVYNVAVVLLLVTQRWGSGLSGIGLWPVVVLHTAFAAWGVAGLRTPRASP